MPLIIEKGFGGPLSTNVEDYPDGILINIDKPLGWTSADAVRKIKFSLRKHFCVKNIKVGHAGTLDPLASGVLIICAGRATKLAEHLQAHRKEYVATVEFGATTPSYDLEKPIDCEYEHSHITREVVEDALKGFIGEIDQVPPIFSAKMVNGTRAYELARAGEQIELTSSRITIYDAVLEEFERPQGGRPHAVVRIACSKGTYIRSFARDLGLAVGSGAHLTALKRTISGDFEIKNAISLDNLKSLI